MSNIENNIDAVDISKERQILEAAEKVFLAKGYAASKTMEIAEMAGVNHALLHYYFRTKENLFNKVFVEKIDLFIDSFTDLFAKELPLFELITSVIETQFLFLEDNDKLPFFLVNEVISSPQYQKMFKERFFSKIKDHLQDADCLLKQEIEKGTIKEITLVDLLISISSLNMFYYMLKPIIMTNREEIGAEYVDMVVNNRKQTHVDVILNWIKK